MKVGIAGTWMVGVKEVSMVARRSATKNKIR